MGYRIIYTEGKLRMPADKAKNFMLDLVCAIKENSHSEATIQACNKYIHNQTDSKFFAVMDAWNSMFLFEIKNRYLEIEYNDIANDGRWYSDDVLLFVNAYAPYASENEFLGFVGEDMYMWSYVFDGRGHVNVTKPKIDWLG